MESTIIVLITIAAILGLGAATYYGIQYHDRYIPAAYVFFLWCSGAAFCCRLSAQEIWTNKKKHKDDEAPTARLRRTGGTTSDSPPV